MATSNRLKAWVRYDGKHKIVPSSLILQANKPKVGTWNEVPVDLCCETDPCPAPDYGEWKVVTGGVAGDGVVLRDENQQNQFTVIGPNDSTDDGWVYLKRFFPLGDTFDIYYKWTSFDDSGPVPPTVDWPVYWNSITEPTGIPADLTVRVGTTPEIGVWTVTVNPGEWFAIGIYSNDSCCGRGFLQVSFDL
jgi:hypothetical protein